MKLILVLDVPSRSFRVVCLSLRGTTDQDEGFFSEGGFTESPAGGAAPSETKVAQVIPDSGENWAVLPGTGGTRIRT